MPSKEDLLLLYGDGKRKKKKRKRKHTGIKIIDNSIKIKQATENKSFSENDQLDLLKEDAKLNDLSRIEEDKPLFVELSDKQKLMVGLELEESKFIENKNQVINPTDRKSLEEALEVRLKHQWGKGRVDIERKFNDKLKSDSMQKEKLIVYETDEILNNSLKERVREGDPMAHLVQSSSKSEEIKSKELQNKVYKGPQGPPNRFNIKPGYRWDGLNRTNGYERKYLSQLNSNEATKRQRYLNEVANF